MTADTCDAVGSGVASGMLARGSNRLLTIGPKEFLLDGKPMRLVSGAMHYFRVLPESWEDRLLKLKALGCNCVETYVAWNVHEPRKGEFDFAGRFDIERFIDLAGSLDLGVIVRPGPYICAEWDFGGLPWWLLRDRDMVLRSSDPRFVGHVEQYWHELIPRLLPRQSTRGGAILAMQVENEYGYYGHDAHYMRILHDLLRELGVDVLLFTSDGPEPRLQRNGGIDGVLRTANFGGGAEKRLAALRQVQPSGPLVCAEFWIGWFDEWGGAKHTRREPSDAANALESMLSAGAGVNFYMFHGGTNFGFTSGANLNERYHPYVTSYDYDALLSESGDITPKYLACREVLARHGVASRGALPEPTRKQAYGEVAMDESIALADALPLLSKPLRSLAPMAMEDLGIGSGYVLYRSRVPDVFAGLPMRLRDVHDWAHVLLDGKSITTWYRNDPPADVKLEFSGEATLDVLVENMGRANFGHQMAERKGLTHGVFFGATLHEERAQFGWECWALPMDNLDRLRFAAGGETAGPGFFRGQFHVSGEPADTFLCMDGWTKGCCFVNGFNLGRYWNIGPQRALYIPAELLKPGPNEIVIFESVTRTGPAATVQLVDHPMLG